MATVNMGQGAYIIKGPDPNETRLEVKQAELPSPDRAFYSSTFSLHGTKSHVEIAFCQMALGSDDAISGAVVVHVPWPDIKRLLTNSAEFFEKVGRQCKKLGFDGSEGRLPDKAGSVRSDRVVHERANIIAMAYTGRDAEIRFYKLAAHEFSRIVRAEKPKKTPLVFPVVQIDLPLSNLGSLVRALVEAMPEGTVIDD